MDEYYEVVLTHRIRDGSRHDLHIEQPIVVRAFISPLMQKSICDEREELIDSLLHKLKDYWMRIRVKEFWVQTNEDGDGNDND